MDLNETDGLTRREACEAWAIIAGATITDDVELFIDHELFEVEAKGLCKIIEGMHQRGIITEDVFVRMRLDLEENLPGFEADRFYWPWSVEGMKSRIEFARKMSELEE